LEVDVRVNGARDDKLARGVNDLAARQPRPDGCDRLARDAQVGLYYTLWGNKCSPLYDSIVCHGAFRNPQSAI
jgi:hypothetical protein